MERDDLDLAKIGVLNAMSKAKVDGSTYALVNLSTGVVRVVDWPECSLMRPAANFGPLEGDA